VALVATAIGSALVGSRGLPRLPAPVAAHPVLAREDPFAYHPSSARELVERATDGNPQVLFPKSPGGVLATAARVAAYRPLIDAATAGPGVDPNIVEAIGFLESAGRPDAIAAGDVADAAELTQIVAQTGSCC
jgi:soluble lytic murein transglycosylase-like protein